MCSAPAPGITGGVLDSHEEMPGPIYLPAVKKGHVAYREYCHHASESVINEEFDR